MKIARLAVIVAGFALAVSCEKPVSEAERNAQIEREVQQRLEAERVAQEKDRLAQQQAELDAREQALADKESATADASTSTTTTAAATPARPRTAGTTTRDRDGRPARSYDTFYRKLEPYGAWRETSDYGYVWQPEQAQRSRNWKPYTDGRWAYTDAGWTWVSEEPFGWATYHYGRWTRLRGVGWVWVPGDEWAPAWVSWRTSDEYVGWAPLPPEARFERRTGIKRWADSYYDIDVGEYVFVPNEEIGAEDIQTVVVPPERNVTIVTQTTNVTNITYSNTYIVNEGPSYDQLRARSRRPVERLRIDRRYEFEGDENPRATVNGGVIAMMAPLFAREVAERPRNVAEPIRQVVVERAVAVADDPETQRARAKMKAEATPPPDAPPKTYEKPVVVEAPAASPAAQAATTATAAPTAPPRASATATPTATPRVAPTTQPTATPTARPSTPTPTPPATASPAAATAPSPRMTATVTPAGTPVASPRATATPTPRITAAATATPAPTATATATPRPVSTARPVASPAATVAPIIAAPTPRTTPVATPRTALSPTATPAIRTPPAAPLLTPPPRGTASPAVSPDSEAATGGDRREQREADRVARQREKDEARSGKVRDRNPATPGSSVVGDAATDQPAGGVGRPGADRRRPQAVPDAVGAGAATTPAQPPVARATPPTVATPAATPTPRAAVPAAVATPPVPVPTAPRRPATTPRTDAASPTPSPSPKAAAKKSKGAADPTEDVDVADNPDAPAAAKEER